MKGALVIKPDRAVHAHSELSLRNQRHGRIIALHDLRVFLVLA